MTYFLLLINIILLVSGQTLWKIGLLKLGTGLTIKDVFRILFNPYILTGLSIYAAATVIWLYVLSRSELSLIYPLQSLCYVAALLVAVFLFKEHIPYTRWLGTLLIISGAFFVSMK